MDKIEKLQKEYNNLVSQRDILMNECVNKGEPWDSYVEKATPIALKINSIRQEINLLKEPELHYLKDDEITFQRLTLDDFKKMCKDGDITDDDGYGKYASEKAVSNIEIYPSDILANKVRTDFSHIAWYNK